MWFKNLQLFRLTKPFTLTPEALHEQLIGRTSRNCGSLEPSTYGWAPPLGRLSEQLTHAANSYIMICARKEEKVLPAAVIKEIMDDKVTQIEQQQDRTIRRKEKEEIKQEVLLDLLPKAFSKANHTYAYIDPKENWIVVDASSPAKAEELVSLLRETLGSLPAVPAAVLSAPASIMTKWADGQATAPNFILEDQCELRDPNHEGSVVRCTKQDLLTDEIQTHLKAGKQATKLAVEWNGHISCILSDDLSIKRLRFLDIIQEAAADEANDEASRFDADFALMTLELSHFIPAVLEAFGGEDKCSSII